MKHNYYIALLFLIAAGFIFIYRESQQAIAPTASNDTLVKSYKRIPEVEKEFNMEVYDRKVKASDNMSTVIATQSSSQQKDAEKTSPPLTNDDIPEPTNLNANMAATGEFANEVNFPDLKNNCYEPCDAENADLEEDGPIANSSNVNGDAVGEFSDQINAAAILAQAQQKDFNLKIDEKLVDVTANSSPPTELGAYSAPQ
jgi:hypothetical protein